MHTPSGLPRIRAMALALVAIMTVSSLWAAVGPAEGLVVSTVEGAQLPVSWTFPTPGSATFNLSLPEGAYVQDATLAMQGSNASSTATVDQSPADWSGLPPASSHGFSVEDGALTYEHADAYAGVSGPGLANYTRADNVDVVSSVRLAPASPKFSADGGGTWAYFKEVAISLDSGSAVYDAFTYLKLDIPYGHCSRADELRIQDWLGKEIPYQVVAVATDETTRFITHVELIFPSDLPAKGTNTYRVYYGNPYAGSPGYPPIYLADEKWGYTDVTDPAFLRAWKQLPWSGAAGAGTAAAAIRNVPEVGNVLYNKEDITLGRTFSQVWTSKSLRYSDFILEAIMTGHNITGPKPVLGLWGIDFRATDTDCYRLVYSEKPGAAYLSRLSLYRVSGTRHLETSTTPSTNWRLLVERFATLSTTSEHLVIIRAQGKGIDVYVDNITSPLLRATDADLSSGMIGTFQGGQAAPLGITDDTVSGAYGPLIVLSTMVNLTAPFPYYVPSEEHRQYAKSGIYESQTLALDGARDAVLDVDISAPPGTRYAVDLLDAEGNPMMTDLTDGSPITEGWLDDGFRLLLRLSTGTDWVTPELRGWGVGYRAAVHAQSGGTPSESMGVHIAQDGVIALAPSRDTWLKEADAVIKPGNLDADAAGVTVGCWVPYSDGWRVFYAGTDAKGMSSICMATTTDGRTFREFSVVLGADPSGLAWDSSLKSPSVIIGQNLWLMWYIGWQNGVGRVGMAYSGDGSSWGRNANPVMEPTGQPGDYDMGSIEDCFVYHDLGLDKLVMYYTGKPTVGAASSYILRATSPAGLVWGRDSKRPVLSPGEVGTDWDHGYVNDPWAVLDGAVVVIYYRGGTAGMSPKPPAVGYAVSDDGIDFKKAKANPVLEPRKGSPVVDDALGISGMMVIEGDRDRFYMLFSGIALADRVGRAFVADSGYLRNGSYATDAFDLTRAPRSLGPLRAASGTTAAASVSYQVRASADSTNWSAWTDVAVNASDQPVAPARYLQLRVVLSSPFGDETPKVRMLQEEWQSNVRSSGLTMAGAYASDHGLVDLLARIDGDGTAGPTKEATADGTSWVAFEDGVTRPFTVPGIRFGYRMSADPQPGDVLRLRHLNFTLGWASLPSGVSLDVGDDGVLDWAHAAPLDGDVVANVTDALRAWMANATATPPSTAVIVPVRLATSTPGVLRLTAVHILLDTPPRISARDPAGADAWVQEGNPVNFTVTVGEDDGQSLSYEWVVDGEPVPSATGARLQYTPSIERNWTAPVQVSVVVGDGRFTREASWTLHVNETPPPPPANKAPLIESWLPVGPSVTVDENVSIAFNVSARDPDGGPQPIAFRWYMNDTQLVGETGTSFTYRPTYSDAGDYTVRVEASDGKDGTNHTWQLTVNDVIVTPPPKPVHHGGEGLPAWLVPLAIILVLVIVGAMAAAYVMSRRRLAAGAPAPAEAQAPAPIEVPAEAETPAGGTGTIGRDVAARPSTLKAAAAGGAGAVPIIGMPLGDLEKDRTFVVEEVYVVYNDGRLVHHACRDPERTGVDTDLFGGMFTAIQQFIHDSMGGEGATSQLGRLDYGDNTILVERGKFLFLAVIIYGEERDVLRDAMRDVLNRIEGAYAGVIERWSGDQGQLAGVAGMVAPLLALTSDLSRETITSRTVAEGVKMLSEVEFYQGYVRLKIAVRNDTRSVITNLAVDIAYDTNVLKVQRIQPDYETLGTKVMLGTVAPREKKTVAYYLDPLICQESDVDGTATYKDASGAFKTVTMKRRRADIVCPIFFTEENANTAMLKRLIKEELKDSDSKLFNIPKILSAKDAFALSKQVVRGHDVRFVREFVEESPSFRGEAWFYGVTKVKKNKMVIRTSVWDDRRTVEFNVASTRIEAVTGLLAELGQNLNEALRERYMGRAKATPVIDETEREAVRGLGLLIDKYSESEAEAGEVDQA